MPVVAPGDTVWVTGVAVNVKPFTVSVTVAVFTRAPLVAVTVTVETPPGVEARVVIVMVVVPEPVTVAGANAAEASLGNPAAANVTAPANPPNPVTVTVEEVALPAFTAAGAVAASVKSVPTVRLSGGDVTMILLAAARMANG